MSSVAAGKSFQQQNIDYFQIELLVNRFSNKILILYSSVGEEHFGISTKNAAFVGAN